MQKGGKKADNVSPKRDSVNREQAMQQQQAEEHFGNRGNQSMNIEVTDT
jgi:hypothetical protein